MTPVRVFQSIPGLALAYLLPVGLWAMLWVGLQSPSPAGIFNPESPIGFLHALRGVSPFAAAWASIVIILVKLSQQRPRGFRFFGPLGLTAVYGLVGIAAAFLSPDISVAFVWAILYLSLPLVLWALVWGTASQVSISRLVNFNWFLIIAGFATLFVITLFSFDLESNLLSLSSFWKCERLGNWYVLTSGLIRSTGVGRFSAITGLIALSMLWRPDNRRALWLPVLYLAIVLLLATGARTSILGFAAAAPLIAILHGGKRAVVIGALALIVLIPPAYNVGIPQSFLQTCIFREYEPAGLDYLQIRSPESAEPESRFETIDQPAEDSPGSDGLISTQAAGVDPNASDHGTFQPSQNGEGKGGSESPSVPETIVFTPTPNPIATTIPASNPSPQPTPDIPIESPDPESTRLPTTDIPTQSPDPESTRLPTTDIPTQSPDRESTRLPTTDIPTQSPDRESTRLPTREIGTPADSPTAVAIPTPVGALAIKSTDSPDPLPTLVIPKVRSVVKPGPDIDGQTTNQTPLDWRRKLESKLTFLPSGSFYLTGRTSIWATGWAFIKQSPILGYGFHADRLVMGTHIHNSILHALIQTGVVGTIPFVAALLMTWMLVFKAIRTLNRLPGPDKRLVILTAGILMFLSVRSILESTGAFFGVDWLLLAPLMLYIQVITSQQPPMEEVEEEVGD